MTVWMLWQQTKLCNAYKRDKPCCNIIFVLYSVRLHLDISEPVNFHGIRGSVCCSVRPVRAQDEDSRWWRGRSARVPVDSAALLPGQVLLWRYTHHLPPHTDGSALHTIVSPTLTLTSTYCVYSVKAGLGFSEWINVPCVYVFFAYTRSLTKTC